MEERGMNERVRMLRRQSVETQPHIYMERAKLMTEAYKLYDGSMSVPEMRATALKYYFQHKTIEIADGELRIDVPLPPGVTATAITPAGACRGRLDGRRLAPQSPGTKIASGRHRLVFGLAPQNERQ